MVTFFFAYKSIFILIFNPVSVQQMNGIIDIDTFSVLNSKLLIL